MYYRMANNESKKPSAEAFRKAVKELGGNLSKVAEYFGVSRGAVYQWRDKDPKFKAAIKDERTKLFDEVLATSRIVALGIPKYEYEVDANGEPVYDSKGNPIRRMVGWAVPPDGQMLRYFLSFYGRWDAAGLLDEEELGGVPMVQEGVDITQWISIRNEGGEKPRKKGGHKKKV